MRRFVLLLVAVTGFATLFGCGGSKSSTSTTINIPANLVISPNTLSLTTGGVTTLSTTVTDVNNSVVTNPPVVTYASSNTAVVNISPRGLVCAGTWDANYIVCTPGPNGTATITASAGTLASTVPVFVHPRVDRVTISPATVDCISMGTQQQLTVQAFASGQEITSQVGPAAWSVSTPSVVAIDSSGVAMASAPGKTTASATIAGVSSLPISFTTCPVAQISVHVSGSTSTSVTMTSGTPVSLVADVYDTKGIKITPSVTWLDSQPIVASVGIGNVTPLIPGTTEFSAVCQATNGCNVNLPPTYSNLVTGTLPGTENPALLVTGSASTSIVPADTATNTLATAVTLPFSPNSLFVNALGQNAVMGSSTAGMTFAVGGSSVATVSSVSGKVLAASNDVQSYTTYDSSRSTLFVVGSNANGVNSTQSYAIAGVAAAAYGPDNTNAYVVAGSNLYHLNGASLSLPILMAAPANDVTYYPSGQFVYVAGGAPNAVTVWATYNNSLQDTVSVPATPLLIRALPDDSQVLAVDNTELDVITPSSSLVGVPPSVVDTLTATIPFGVTLTPRKIIVSPDSAHAAITSDQGSVLVYTKATGAITSIATSGGATCYTGGFSLDGVRLYVGCSDNSIHVIDVSQLKETGTIGGIGFLPDLVAIRPK